MKRRVAFFTDSFHEVNGVALTSREYVAHARRERIPLFSVHTGPRNQVTADGSVVTFEFERGPLRLALEHDLAFDLLFLRHRRRLSEALREFQPDLVHITGPGDAGILGALAAFELKVPLAASWHTNLHEFAGRRLSRILGFLPNEVKSNIASWTERTALDLCTRFYRLAKVLFAPNPELVDMLASRTGRPAFPMARGIDSELFSPMWRHREDDTFVIGYVGRLSPEKNVRMLATLESALRSANLDNYRFLVVGEGSDRAWLQSNLRQAELPGILRAEALARAYANMDVFLFPSSTDTFGNVVLEAMASGIPPIVTSSGGPKFLVEHGKTGYVVDEFATAVLELQRDETKRLAMSVAARRAAERFSWDAVFESVHQHYDECFTGRGGSDPTPLDGCPISLHAIVG